MTKVIFEYNGKSKKMPISDIKSPTDIAKAYQDIGLKIKKSKKIRLGYTLPNGKRHSFLTIKNHKYAVCWTGKDAALGFCYTDDYAVAATTAANWCNRYEYKEQRVNGDKFVVVDIYEVK